MRGKFIKMKNKKASLLAPETVVKIIIAVLCIVVLLYLLNQTYGIFKTKSKLEQAEGRLKEIKSVVNEVGKEGQAREYTITNPKGWSLVGGFEENKNLDFGKKTLCFCPEIKGRGDAGVWLSCKEKGVCGDAEYAVEFKPWFITIDQIKKIYFTKEGEVVKISEEK